MPLPQTIKLSTGYSMPVVGLGTWQSKPNEVKDAVETALRQGYRHIDAASVYGNESEVGAGIKASGVPRDEIFITSKLWNTDHEPKYVLPALEKTLKDLGTDYLDLYLIHFPISFPHLPEAFPVNPETEEIWVTNVSDSDTWKAMESLLDTGKVRSIGVSNFTRERIEKLMETSTILPAANQIEGHPYLQQPALLEWHKEMGIATVCYSPMGNNIYNLPRCVDDPAIISMAKHLGQTPAQVLISWGVQRGSAVLTKSVTPARIKENFEVSEIPQQQFHDIANLDRHHRYNFPARIGVDIFGEVDQKTLRLKVEEWKAEQRRLNMQRLHKVTSK